MRRLKSGRRRRHRRPSLRDGQEWTQRREERFLPLPRSRMARLGETAYNAASISPAQCETPTMTRRYSLSALLLCASSCFSWPSASSLAAEDKPAPVKEIKGDSRTPLPGTKKLEMEGDIAAQLVDGVDKFLLREIEKSVEGRAKFWKRDLSSPEAYNKSIEPNRQRLAHILGVRDKRIPF